MQCNSSSNSRARLQHHLLWHETHCVMLPCVRTFKSCVSGKATSCSALCELLGWRCHGIQSMLIWEVGFYFCQTTQTLPQWFAFVLRLTQSFHCLLSFVPFTTDALTLKRHVHRGFSRSSLCFRVPGTLQYIQRHLKISKGLFYLSNQRYTGNSRDTSPAHSETTQTPGIWKV
jgi:hypothetical protein